MRVVKFPDAYLNWNNQLVVNISGIEYSVVNSSMPRCCVRKSSDQSIPSSVWTNLLFDLEDYDIVDMHDNVTNNSRVVVPEYGEYRINYHIKHDLMDKTLYESRVIKNGSIVIEGTCDTATGSKDSMQSALGGHSYLVTFETNDYLELQFYHDKDVAQNVLLTNTFFEVYRVY